MAMQHGAAQIAIDEKNVFPMACEGRCEIARDQSLSFGGDRTGDEKCLGKVQFGLDLDRTVYAQESFSAWRILIRERQQASILSGDICEVRDNSEQVSSDERFNIPGTLNAIVDKTEADRDAEKYEESEPNRRPNNL